MKTKSLSPAMNWHSYALYKIERFNRMMGNGGFSSKNSIVQVYVKVADKSSLEHSE